MSKSPKKSSKSSSKEDKVGAYVASLDLRTMWEDFSMSTNDKRYSAIQNGLAILLQEIEDRLAAQSLVLDAGP